MVDGLVTSKGWYLIVARPPSEDRAFACFSAGSDWRASQADWPRD